MMIIKTIKEMCIPSSAEECRGITCDSCGFKQFLPHGEDCQLYIAMSGESPVKYIGV